MNARYGRGPGTRERPRHVQLTPNRRHAAYKRFTSGFVVMVLIEEAFEAGSARLYSIG